MIRELCKQARGLVDTFSASKGLLPHGAVKRSSRSSEITTNSYHGTTSFEHGSRRLARQPQPTNGRLKKMAVLFVDPAFPSVSSSVGPGLPEASCWLRCAELWPRAALPPSPGDIVVDIDGRTVEMGGLTVGGIGGAGPDRMGFSYEWSEQEIRGRDPLDVDVLVSHCPPAASPFDRIARGDHVGSQAVRERVESMHGVAVFGHIHESSGVDLIGECLCMNLGGMGPPAAHPRAGWVFGTDAVVLRDVTTGKEHSLKRPENVSFR